MMHRILLLCFFSGLVFIACQNNEQKSILWGIDTEGTFSRWQLYIYADSSYSSRSVTAGNVKEEKGIVLGLGADTMRLFCPKDSIETICIRKQSTYVIHEENPDSEILSQKIFHGRELWIGKK